MPPTTKSNDYANLLEKFGPKTLKERRYRWLVTGAAGFIGSHLAEALLSANQTVVGLDDLSAGYRHNVDLALAGAGEGARARFRLIEGSITDPDLCRATCEGVDFVLHQAALASVPLSMERPLEFSSVNTEGFVNVLEGARAQGVRRVVYASSSAVYGDDPQMPKTEAMPGLSLSPYALTKAVNELYAELWTRVYGLETVGLRYFNVFGPRQDPNGAYAAVIPRWSDAVQTGKAVVLYGDGSATRDFCSVRNVVLANLLAATTDSPEAPGHVFNIACGAKTTLGELLDKIRRIFSRGADIPVRHEPTRPGDIPHSLASVERAETVLGYVPRVSLEEGLWEMSADPDHPRHPASS